MAEQEPKEDVTKEGAADELELGAAEGEGIEELKKALAEAREKAEANLAGWQRAQADFINYKRRIEQEKAETIKYANAELILKLLPILDDFERALSAVPLELSCQSWVEGMKLIERKIWSMLELQGVTRIRSVGEVFNPSLYEAVTYGPGKEYTVIQELEKGYKLHDRVIRPAKVIVGKGGEGEQKEE